MRTNGSSRIKLDYYRGDFIRRVKLTCLDDGLNPRNCWWMNNPTHRRIKKQRRYDLHTDITGSVLKVTIYYDLCGLNYLCVLKKRKFIDRSTDIQGLADEIMHVG